MSKRRRDKQRLAHLSKRQPTQSPASAPALNLGYMNAVPIATKPKLRTQVIVAGCGGIGAYMVMHIGRLMRVLYEKQEGVNLTLCDPDIVKEENLGRQLFCDAEVGQPKAIALASRYGQAWGLNTIAYVDEYSERLLLPEMDLCVLVGCVDNAAARNALHETLTHNPDRTTPQTPPEIWWLDCGNLKDTGRVLLGSAYNVEQLRGSFVYKNQEERKGGHCIALPSPGLQYPSLLIPEKEETAAALEMSCAELQMANLQSLNINAGIAVQAADMLTRLLVTDDLKRYQCAVNLASGSVKSWYCTPSEVAREINRPESFVIRQQQANPDRLVMDHLRELTGAEAVA